MNFREILEKDYFDMLDLKESLGFSRITYQPHLREFLAYCSENYPKDTNITKTMFENWLQLQHFETNSTHNNAVSRIRAFTRFQAAMGKETFIPDERYSVKKVQYVPYILSDNEMRELFHAFDILTPHFEAPRREIIVPVLFRMLYCCGMRPSEPLNLLCEDVDLHNGDIYIRASKRKKDRRIIMSAEMTVLCRKYDAIAGRREFFLNVGMEVNFLGIG